MDGLIVCCKTAHRQWSPSNKTHSPASFPSNHHTDMAAALLRHGGATGHSGDRLRANTMGQEQGTVLFNVRGTKTDRACLTYRVCTRPGYDTPN